LTDPTVSQGNETEATTQLPSSQPLLLRGLLWGGISTTALIAIFAGLGWVVAGSAGLIGGVLGATIGGALLLFTTGSIAFANRFVASPSYIPIFSGIVLGGWLVKFGAFLTAALLLRNQPWLDPKVMFFGILAGILVSIVIDVIVLKKTRVPYVS
jgi:hypothetical protein